MNRSLALACAIFLGCGGGGDSSGLDGFLPPLPKPDGTPQSVYAGGITSANTQELIPGPATSGIVGDTFMRNSVARFVIQSPARVIGIVPWGGNLVDATLLDAQGHDVAPDHLGEVSLVYMLGRTCAHTEVDVLLDGSGGGPAVVRAIGKSAVNDYINLKGMGYLPVSPDIDPDNSDNIACATTYTLQPGSNTLNIAWTLYNPDDTAIQGPFGALNDTGGSIQVFAPNLGFSHITSGLDSILSSDDASVPYNVYQGPGIAYGIVPRLATPDQHSAGLVVAGAGLLLFGASEFLDFTDRTKDYLHLPAKGGVTYQMDLVVARDGAAVDEVYHNGRGEPITQVSGQASYAPSGTPAAAARVTVFADANHDGILHDNDPVVTYFDTATDGSFTGSLPPGTYMVRADVPDISRSNVALITVGATPLTVPALSLPDPVTVDFTVVDDDHPTDPPMPVKITVIGVNPLPPDARFIQTYERRPGVVRLLHAIYGTSMPAGADPGDPAILLPAGGPYRIFFSHGPEWSVAQYDLPTATAGAHLMPPVFTLKREVDTTGYLATAFHEHSLGSPDSPVDFPDRVKSLVTEGVEFFAGTDHDRVTDYGPVIDALGMNQWTHAVPGIEATPFAYGHFNAYPINVDANDPSGGAVDWGASSQLGFAMLPEEIWTDLRARGAKVVQVCHPRNTGFTTFQAYFRRAGLAFDFDARTITGPSAQQEVPSDYLRLPPGMTLYSEKFDTLEIWNGFYAADTDGDGVLEYNVLDQTLRDWMNFLSFGKLYTPLGNGDTHTLERDAAGMPRSLVRVPDDSSAGLALAENDVWNTLLGANNAPKDIVVTDGPMLQVSVTGQSSSAIGQVVTVTPGQPVSLDITATAAEWADFDTIEVFANNTFDPLANSNSPSSLQPVACYTTRTGLAASDPCGLAPIKGTLTVGFDSTGLNHGFQRRLAKITTVINASDIPTRAGHTGDDAWIVVRVRGRQPMFPILVNDALDDTNLTAVTTGDAATAAAALLGKGSAAMAFTAPIFVDFDGGGWKAPFAP